MKKFWPTLLNVVLAAAVAVGICTVFQATRPVVPDGVQAQVVKVAELHGSGESDRTREVDGEALADCLALLRSKRRPFSRKVAAAPDDCYEVVFTAGQSELYALYLDWTGEGFFYDISTTSSYALEGQGDAFREIIDRMLEK